MSTPTLAEFMAALLVVEGFLLAKVDELRAKFPEYSADLDRLVDYLKVHGRTLETLTLVAKELQVLGAGEGPVEHDPVDLA